MYPVTQLEPNQLVDTNGASAGGFRRASAVSAAHAFCGRGCSAPSLVSLNLASAGAGDAFVGGFLSQLVAGKEMVECVRGGACVAPAGPVGGPVSRLLRVHLLACCALRAAHAGLVANRGEVGIRGTALTAIGRRFLPRRNPSAQGLMLRLSSSSAAGARSRSFRSSCGRKKKKSSAAAAEARRRRQEEMRSAVYSMFLFLRFPTKYGAAVRPSPSVAVTRRRRAARQQEDCMLLVATGGTTTAVDDEGRQ